MQGWGAILRAWDFEPSIVIGCGAMLVLDLAAVRWRVRHLSGQFVLGVAILAFALVSPIDALSDDYLFTAHMLQHLLLVLVVPPLIVSGLPADRVRALLRVRAIAAVERGLAWLPVAWIVGIGTLAVWHLPTLYNAALADEDLHIVEHLCFLVSATIFWWPVFTPVEERRPRLLPAVVHVISGAYANAIIGAVLLAAPIGIYPAYLHPEDPLHILAFVRGAWGMTAAEDHQTGALLMILGGSFPFAAATAWVLWSHRRNEEPAASAEQ
jgi:putative membrane protein